MSRGRWWKWASMVLVLAGTVGARAGGSEGPARDGSRWRHDYGEAMREAAMAHKMMLVFFYDPKAKGSQERLDEELFGDRKNGKLAERCVLVKLPVDAKARVGGKEITLLKHEAFAEMENLPGLAMIDMTDRKSEHYREVVSVYPFERNQLISRKELAVLLDLPEGSLTQRTLIFAVRTYPEKAASAEGRFDRFLAEESEKASSYQAAINVQGHHNWDSRFQEINARLPGGLSAQEVCAESWPGQNLLDAARECVRSWRQSPGHWSAVRAWHPLFGYDMKRGSNGVWFATGIFAQRQ